MRYWAAILVSVLIMIALLAYQRHVAAKFERVVRQSLRDAKAAGVPSLADIDPETAELTDFGTEVPAELMTEMLLAGLLRTIWLVWIPLVVAGCLLVARLIPAAEKTGGP